MNVTECTATCAADTACTAISFCTRCACYPTRAIPRAVYGKGVPATLPVLSLMQYTGRVCLLPHPCYPSCSIREGCACYPYLGRRKHHAVYVYLFMEKLWKNYGNKERESHIWRSVALN